MFTKLLNKERILSILDLKFLVKIGDRETQIGHILPTSRAKPINPVVANMTKQLSRATWTLIHKSFSSQRS